MKRYKEIENGIEYEVFEMDEVELYFEVKRIEKIEHSKVIRTCYGCREVFYFKNGEAHNDWGPCSIRIYPSGSICNCGYWREGEHLSDEEWKCFYRTKMIDDILKKCECYEKIREENKERNY